MGEGNHRHFKGGRSHEDVPLAHGAEETGVHLRIRILHILKVAERPVGEEHRIHGGKAVDRHGHALAAQDGFQLGGEGFHACLKRGVIAGLEHGERGDARGHGERIPGKRSGLIHVPGGSHTAHVLAFAAERPNGQAAADDLAEGGQIGRDAETGLRPAVLGAEAGDHLIHDEQRAVRVAQGPQRLEEAFLRQHEAHVSGNGLHDDRRDVLAVQVENVLDGPHVIVGG